MKNLKKKNNQKKKEKKHLYERWTTPKKKSEFVSIYNYVADLVNNNTVF